MNKVFLLVLMIGLYSISVGQNDIPAGAKRTKIINAGLLYSTYWFTEAELEQVKKVVPDQAQLDSVMKYSYEFNWPEAINSLEQRKLHRSDIMKLKVYKWFSFEEHTMLVVPLSKNRKSRIGLTRTIYFVIGTAGIKG